ncbi:hypothetical protein GCM10012289_10130 [Nonomuraea cavernae]|uniref:Uncharacterized protein n=1 Tax=Nonomuraea cavernae TaxID=2045107 RepID=A0A918DGJ2_9ACTN|nr:hypothetical protein GCM10012289_10130 [Nonomuraea cavernae]
MGQTHRQDDQVDDRGGDDGGERDKARGGDRQAEHALIVAPSRRRRQRPLANCVVLARSPLDGQDEENDSGDDGYDDEGGEEQHE